MASTLAILRQLCDGGFHSGQALGRHAGISRTAVWKIIHRLKKDFALEIHAVSGRGYRLAEPLELLDEPQIRAHLAAASAGQSNGIEIVTTVDSTNRYLRDRLSLPVSSGHVVLAEQQTAGRGRRGRRWISPFGANIYLSMLQVFETDASQLAGLSLAVAVAVNRALIKLDARGTGLKWPNDIHWQGRKLSGILLEMQGETSGAWNVIIGIGLNIGMKSEAAEDIEQDWTELNSILAQRVDRNKMVALLIAELETAMQQFRQQQLQAFLAEWRRHDVSLDKPVQLHLHDRIIDGIARGIDEQGALKLESEGMIKSYHAGDVSLRYQRDD